MTITPASAATPDNAVPTAANAHPVAPAANAHSVAPAASATPASPDVRKARQLTRSDFDFFEGITLRYADNDANGHVNNAYYYSFFDTSVDAFLMATGYRSALRGEYQTLVVASECRYFSQVSSPGRIEVGVRIGRVGNSTVQYELAVFSAESPDLAAAQGTFTHCCVRRATQRPTPIPDDLRTTLDAVVRKRQRDAA